MSTRHTKDVGMDALMQAIEIAGGQSALARSIGWSAHTVNNWIRRASVPVERCPAIELVTKGAVRCEDLRPDVEWSVLRHFPRAGGDISARYDQCQMLIADCEQYLKDGETPAQRICRERRETDVALTLLAREKQKCALFWQLVQDAAPIVAEYANRNQKHLFRDAMQDPCGAHAWIERMRSATCSEA